jgi:YidC/Oxa1 family membrane protein insertase
MRWSAILETVSSGRSSSPPAGIAAQSGRAEGKAQERVDRMEKRLLLAFVLSAAILLAWSVIFPPPPPPPPITEDAAPSPESVATAAIEDEVAAHDESPATTQPLGADAVNDVITEATAEELVEVSNDVVTVVLSNRGAAVTSYRLHDYDGDGGAPLDLIQTVPLPESTLPLQLITANGPDRALYEVERLADGAMFRWSDGRGSAVMKKIALSGAGYGLDVEMTASGVLAGAAISVGTGMRDLDEIEQNNRLALWGEGVVMADGEVEQYKRKKVKEALTLETAQLGFIGFEDAYFLNVLRPASPVERPRIEPLEFSVGGDDNRKVLRISVVPQSGVLRGQLLGAPKEYDLLQKIDHGVEKTLNFGIFGPISVFFLKALRWIYGHVGNYGVAIILLTLGIRILLFPLMHTSTVSMRKMARVQPKVKEIQAKYKKKKSDPQARTKMNQEMMALYKEEGVNPMAGCLPLLVQLPLLWALYRLFLHAIELRHAPFYLWITDLSAKDPLYITPILMTATMWLQQRLAPQAGDPQQQRLMRMMPLIFGIMFLQFPSGLVLYWLANNLITILQQEITLHLVGERKFGSRFRRGKAKGRKG